MAPKRHRIAYTFIAKFSEINGGFRANAYEKFMGNAELS